jgi:ubiquinone/menaquinone biosynthesis C-methylase UbiE
VGCGTGHWSRFFAELGYAVFGLDISPAMIEKAGLYDRPKCCFIVADAVCLPFADHSFEVVTSMAAVEFIADSSAAIAEMVRCTRPNGRVIIGALNKDAPLNRDRLAQGREPYLSAHLFSPQELRLLLDRFGRAQVSVSQEAPIETGPAVGAFMVAHLRPLSVAIDP